MKMLNMKERLQSFREKYGQRQLATAGLLAAVIVTAIGSIVTNQMPTVTHIGSSVVQKIPSAAIRQVAAKAVSSEKARAAEQKRVAEQVRREEARRVAEAKQAQWRAMLPRIYDHSHDQFAEVFGTAAGIREGFNDVRLTLSADTFAEEVIGWESTAVRFQSKSDHVDWMRARFYDQVLNPADIKNFLTKKLNRLHQSMTDCNRRLMKELGLSGATYKPEQISVPVVDFSWLDQRIDSLLQSTGDEHLQLAWGETVASQVAGNAVLYLFNAGANSLLGTNQKEGESVFSSPFGTAGDVASGFIASEIAEEIIATSANDLSNRIERDLQTAFMEICGDDKQPPAWQSLFADLLQQHFMGALTAIATDIGVDPEYAKKSLEEYSNNANKKHDSDSKAAVHGGAR